MKRKEGPQPGHYVDTNSGVQVHTSEFKEEVLELYSKHKPFRDDFTFHEKFLSTTWPHIASFNLFLDFYVKEIVKSLEPVYIDPTRDLLKTDLNPFHNPLDYLKISISNVSIGQPRRVDNETSSKGDIRMFPRHARVSHVTYGAPMYITFVMNSVGANEVMTKEVLSGLCPVMVRSKACHLSKLNPFQMTRYAGEDVNEPGGYFIVNGNERGIRFVIQQRCNYAIGIKKERFKDRGVLFSEYAVSFRGARRDGTSTNNILYYTEDNQCVFRILLSRSEWTCPFWAVLKALFPTVQLDLVKSKLLDGLGSDDPEIQTDFDQLWEDMVEEDILITDRDQIEDRYLSQLGSFFWHGVANRMPPGATHATAGKFILDNYVLVHTDNYNGKLETLIHMWRKLWSLKRGHISPENVDSFAFQELIGPGQLCASVLKDSLFNTLQSIRLAYVTEIRAAQIANNDISSLIRNTSFFDQTIRRSAGTPARALSYFLATGNIRTYQLDLQQTAGWSITTDRLNMNRFISHFRAVHRGQFFTQMRTTDVRKLTGETWGFVCPVHTPDGPSCGLLLHMSQDTIVVSDPPDGQFRALMCLYLESKGFKTDISGRTLIPGSNAHKSFALVVDGEPLCHLDLSTFDEWEEELRSLKTTGKYGFPAQIELCAFKPGSGVFPGIYLFSGAGRVVRPVRSLATGKVEWIGNLAQPWLNIACTEEDVAKAEAVLKKQESVIKTVLDGDDNDPSKQTAQDAAVKPFNSILADYASKLQTQGKKKDRPITTGLKSKDIVQACPVEYQYVEVSPTSFLSMNAAFTPLSNHNQSPRNMYQCQMLKQTMGTPYHNITYRTDNKSYRILNPNRPLARNHDYVKYDLDPYASGTNAIVAVISYTGFDMEDAMIINRHSMERGEFHGCVYKTKVIEAAPSGTRLVDSRNFVFGNRSASGLKWEEELSEDGLPPIGTLLKRNSAFYRTEDISKRVNDVDGSAGHVARYHDDEEAYVEAVHLIGPDERSTRHGTSIPCQRALIVLRSVRNPIIGDKFASRAGQKGILSLLYPPEDMPFSASGITPDIIFNPHGFPSRMTIGMILECMAGKAAAIHGSMQDTTPFRKYPRQESYKFKKNTWIDQGGYNGWCKRGKRYMTEEELRNYDHDEPVDYFGKALLGAGYQYYGSEPLYSGIHGNEMTAHIFMGVIYYQRLRHMVSDKWQCRSVGPIDHLTRQPLKGRKRGGGVRLGEMERDALLGHGAAFMLQDRLLNCSDGHIAYLCPKCGSILSPCVQIEERNQPVGSRKPLPICRVCSIRCRAVNIPYVFRYLCNELSAMNIAIKLQVTECDKPVTAV